MENGKWKIKTIPQFSIFHSPFSILTTETQQANKILGWLHNLIMGTQWQGHVFAVGGCCRDMIMGRPINDIDLAVDLVDGGVDFAKWLAKKGLTIGRPVIFARYGTAMVHLRRFGGTQVEIVQTRKAKYTPEMADTPEQAFGTVEDDAHRRDLTINSLYLDLSTFKMVDYCGALDDINARILRTPMDADEIFIDDPVRALRVLRFATTLGWSIDANVTPAIRRNAHLLSSIKVERIANEFEKMMASEHPGLGIRLLVKNDVMPFVLPGVEKLSSKQLSAIISLIDNKALTDPAARVAAICIMMSLTPEAHDSALEIGQSLLRRLHLSTDVRHKVDFYTRNWQCTERWGARLQNLKPRLLRGFLRMCGTQKNLDQLLTLINLVRRYAGISSLQDQVALIRQAIDEQNLIDTVYNNIPAPAPTPEAEPAKPKRRKKRRKKTAKA